MGPNGPFILRKPGREASQRKKWAPIPTLLMLLFCPTLPTCFLSSALGQKEVRTTYPPNHSCVCASIYLLRQQAGLHEERVKDGPS